MRLQMRAYLIMERFLTYKNVQQVRAAYSEWFDNIMANYDESDDLVLANRIRMSAFYASSFSKFHPLVRDKICNPIKAAISCFQLYDI